MPGTKRKLSFTPTTARKRRATTPASSARRAYTAITRIPRTMLYRPTILNKQQRVKFVYGDQLTGVTLSTAGSLFKLQFNMNSIYDPYYTGTGHQPRGYDQLSQLYEKYTVLNARAKVTFMNNGASDLYVGLGVRDSNSSSSVLNDELEYHGSKGGILQRKTDGTNPAGQNTVRSFSVSTNMKSFTGEDDVYADNNSALMGANPTNQVILDVFATSIQAVAGSFTVLVEITYDVMLREPKSPAIS